MKKSTVFVCVGISAILIVLGCFFDLAITQNLYIENNIFSIVMEILGQTLMTFLAAFCCIVLFESNKHRNGLVFSIIKVGLILASFVIVFYDFFKIYNRVWFLVLAVFVSVAIVFAMWKIVQKIPEDKLQSYGKFCLKFLIYIAIIFALNQVVKYVWGRPRFVDLITNLTLQDYREVWQPYFFSGYKSFYSGHTVAICSILPLISIVENSNYNNKIKVALKAGILSLVLITMLSRLIAGDHFLTDVSFAFLICSVICAFIFKKTKIKQ